MYIFAAPARPTVLGNPFYTKKKTNMYFWLTKYLMHELCFIKMVKQLTFFWSQKGGVKELGEQSIF